jgi:hypothetical protein
MDFLAQIQCRGTFAKDKAWLVACGFTQTLDSDYKEIFSLVVIMTPLHVLISIVAIYNYHIHEMDITTAFLHGQLAI